MDNTGFVTGREAGLCTDLVEPQERREPGQQEPSHGLPRDQGQQVDSEQMGQVARPDVDLSLFITKRKTFKRF